LKKLSIISFAVPFPANFGGVTDVMYKIKALHALGVEITLHCFTYRDFKPSNELKLYCKEVYYYPRIMGLNSLLSYLPYIVKSRKNKELLHRITQNNDPILFEGTHSCGWINHPSLLNRIKIVRNHNIEPLYYNQLAINEKNYLKKIHFYVEHLKILLFEKQFRFASALLPITEYDKTYYKKINDNSVLVNAFHANLVVKSKIGLGNYILYHGDLSVYENKLAAINLINNVFSKITIPCIVAGKSPDNELKLLISRFDNIQLHADVSDEEMQLLIIQAHINLLITNHTPNQTTGIKIKLIQSLYNGRFCIVNQSMIEHTPLSPLCLIANSPTEQLDTIHRLMNQAFDQQSIDQRNELLAQYFDTNNEVRKILTLL